MDNGISARQGDVYVEQITEEEFNAEVKKDEQVKNDSGRVILAYGEVTGHAHAIPGTAANLFGNDEGVRFLQIETPTNLTHEEHSKVELPEGFYRVVRQREYSPEKIRFVAD